MQSKIKFRAKRVDNSEWVYGFIYELEPPLVCIALDGYKPQKSKWFIARTAFADWSMPRQMESFEVKQETISQLVYVYEQDEQQIEVYTNDIVYTSLNRGMIGVVRTHDVAFRQQKSHCHTGKVKEMEIPISILPSKFKIIGNLFDNPELANIESE